MENNENNQPIHNSELSVPETTSSPASTDMSAQSITGAPEPQAMTSQSMGESSPTTPTSQPMPSPMMQAPQPMPPQAGMQQPTFTGDPNVQTPRQSAGDLVLQWLTYAFWGWAILAMSFLSTGVVLYFITKQDTSTFDEYSLAAVLILVPIAMVCDRFYSKKEPAKKVGGALVIMVIHAVIFALIAVGTLIVTAFTLVAMFTSSTSDRSQSVAVIASSLIIFVFYVLTLLRTLNPSKLAAYRKIFTIVMPTIMFLFIILAIFGPMKHVNDSKNDTLIDSTIPTVSTDIDNYLTDHSGAMPKTYQDLNLSGDELAVFERGLVTYKYTPPKPTPLSTTKSSTTGVALNYNYATDKTFDYKLCATYKYASANYKSGRRYSVYSSATSYADTSYHPAGDYCYQLTATYYPQTYNTTN